MVAQAAANEPSTSKESKCEFCRSFDMDDEHCGNLQLFSNRGLKFSGLAHKWAVKGKETGCGYCSLMIDILDAFVPCWGSEPGDLFISVELAVTRPLEFWVSRSLSDRMHDQMGDVLRVVHLGIEKGWTLLSS